MSEKHILVGVDPGVITGIAIFNTKAKSPLYTWSGTWWDAMDMLKTLDQQSTLIFCEDSSRHNFTYKRHGKDASHKISRNAGMNQGYSRLLIEGLKRLGFTVVSVAPRAKKLTADQFRRLTDYTVSTNQHERDAAMVVLSWRGEGKIILDKIYDHCGRT